MNYPALLLAGAALVVPCLAQTTAPSSATNPFFEEWKTPFGVPPFNRIQPEHFMPAFQKAIAENRKEVDAIIADPAQPTFSNTIEALDRAGEMLEKVGGVFFNLSSAETNDKLQKLQQELAPLLSALGDDILLNDKLFAKVKKIYEARASLKLDREQQMLLDRTYKSFIRRGAHLGAAEKDRLRAINKESSLLSVRFGNNLLKETNGYKLIIADKAQLEGLPESVVAAGADAAKAAGQPGKWMYTLHAPSIWPFVSYAKNRELRRQMVDAYIKRCDHGDEYDNKAILTRTAALRAERAKLLGYQTHAHYVLEENMAKEPKQVYALLDRLWEPALRVAGREAQSLQAMIDKEGGKFQLEPWDWRYYAEKVKKAEYDFDEDEIRPYFSLENVLQGAFTVSNKLYGITFIERKDIPKYHPDVRTFEVKDKDGKHLGVFMADYHPRPGKRVGAWSSRYRGQQIADGKDIRPVVVNVGNFSRPTGDQPALLRLEEVETLFHELGHGLHSLMARIHYKSLSSTPRDFVELPSQIMENWAAEPSVMKLFAKHYKTGEVIPDALIEKIQKASKFNQGFATVEYLAASYLDMDWHSVQAGQQLDAAAFEKESLTKRKMMPQIVSRYRSPYFQHVFAGGYSAGYYSYIWSEVLDSDAYQAFKEKGLFDQGLAKSFRENVLERGGTVEAMEMYKNFRGREPEVAPLLKKRGLQ